ncbi:MAG TPA: phosphatase PAP2-related protein [Bryobacteraceae bacterium]|jgi:hypothetical protein
MGIPQSLRLTPATSEGIFKRKIFVRCSQAAAVIAVYAAWLLTQALLERTRGLVPTFIDHTHLALAGVNAFLNAHPSLSNVILAVSSFEVDLAAFSMVLFFFTQRKSRPLLSLWLILIMRQLCQSAFSIAPPPGMIWHYPGFPSIVVTYSTSSDFFFSGHMALATLLAAELTAHRAARWKQAIAWAVIGIQALVILSMRFHYVTDVVTGFLAALAATQIAGRVGYWLDERYAPWSRHENSRVAASSH